MIPPSAWRLGEIYLTVGYTRYRESGKTGMKREGEEKLELLQRGEWERRGRGAPGRGGGGVEKYLN
jgi:hypothetical protein